MLDFANLTSAASPYTEILLGLVVSLLFKDLAASMSKGLAFKYNPAFNEGDTVIVDDEIAIIVKIGFRHTTFGIVKPNASYVWRYVRNDRIQFLKLEKVVKENVIS